MTTRTIAVIPMSQPALRAGRPRRAGSGARGRGRRAAPSGREGLRVRSRLRRPRRRGRASCRSRRHRLGAWAGRESEAEMLGVGDGLAEQSADVIVVQGVDDLPAVALPDHQP